MIATCESVLPTRQMCCTPLWSLLLLLLLSILSQPLEAQPLTPNEQSVKTDLLVVTAHPDDESLMAATMARYADEGKKVALVVCTRGEGGGNSTGKESGAALGIVREAELRRCLALLGTSSLTFLNQPDWAYTESVQATLKRWGHKETLRRLVRVVRLLKPDVIATMDPAPRGGQHGHHQAAGRLATEVFDAAADPRAFPEQIEEEGLAPWRVRKLYWVGGGTNSQTQIATDGITKGVLASTSPGKRYADIARFAESHHRSQGFDKYFGTPAASNSPARPDRFLLVKSRVASASTGETDLFANLQENVAIAEKDLLASSLPSPPPSQPVVARLQPGSAVRNYRAWLRANQIERLMTRLPTEIPVTIGIASSVVVEVTNTTSLPQTGQVALHLPSGWKAKAERKSYRVAPNATLPVTFTIQVPKGAPIAGYAVKVQIEGGSETDAGKLNALPQLRVSRLRRALPVDADQKKWERSGIAPVTIPPTSVAQGSVGSASEISGQFFVGHDATGIQVLVDVTDDTVVSNIAPDDIKAHWRTTSVEICLDPTPRSENTFGTLKLGIFPFDTTGRVRAARDADANPGPVEKKEPSILLASQRKSNGYIVEARIPWKALRSTMLTRPAKGQRVGFNVILYHAGKKEARVGEDINKSRLAWSFWSGVWGRPEMWGTAFLE